MTFLGAALMLYQPAMRGDFVSDDVHYVRENAYIHTLSFENVVTILDPTGPATVDVVNYSPVQLLIHAVAWNAFGSETTGHHAINVVLHALASVLLIALFAASGIPPLAAVFGGAIFLVHPANVEAVAWISQLKTSSSMVLMLAALLAFPNRRGLATLLFALSLLAKPTAAVALPVVALLAWTRESRVPWRWIGVWAVLLCLFAIAEFSVHQRSGAAEAAAFETPLFLVMTMCSLAMRYVVMAATSLGVSAFHEPDPVRSAADAWWLASLPTLALLGWRMIACWRGRRAELAYWTWALASFGPVSQIFPFLYPLADRYLYYLLPGLLGGALLAGSDAARRLWPDPLRRRRAVWAGVAAGVALCAGFAAHSHRRAAIWRYPATLVADAARHYPEGVSASLLRARAAAQRGDAEAAAQALTAAVDRGFNRFEQVYANRMYAPVRDHPRFRAVLDGIAAGRIARVAGREDPTQQELRMAAHAHIVRREYQQARETLKRALALGGARDAAIRSDLQQLARVLE